MITDKDVQKLLIAFSNIFSTKDDLKELWQKIDDQMVDFRNDTNDRVDAVYKELIAKRDEQSMHTHSHMRQDDKLQDHDLRIGRLESKPLAR